MNFAMKVYWIFLLVVVIGVRVLPVRFRKPWLLLASFFCYATWSVPYLALLVGAAALNHFGAKWILAGDRERRGRVIIAGNILLLGVFKYLAWVMGMFVSAATWFGVQLSLPIPKWALPLGISFYLFECISYIIDLMRRREKIHSFWDFQLFIAFFPKLISGPILRAKEFLPQLERPLTLDMHDLRFALREICVGMFVKLVVADSIGMYVARAYQRPVAEVTSIDAWLMALAFGVQIYLDFSGYTRMAIGSAKLCGIDLVANFDYPFISTSPPEFWRRWHMSLSRWIRDYLFLAIAQGTRVTGTKEEVKRRKRLLRMWAGFISMAIFGVWHGAGWTYAAWGVFHGLALAAYHMINIEGATGPVTDGENPDRPRSPLATARSIAISVGGWLLTMMIFNVGFILFRAASITTALGLLSHAFQPFKYPGRTVADFATFRVLGLFAIILVVSFIARQKEEARKARKPVRPSRILALVPDYVVAGAEAVGLGILFVLSALQMTGKNATFLYFQF